MTPVNINGREYFYKVVADYRFTPFHTTKFYIRGPIIIEDNGYIILSLIIPALISCVIFGIISFLLFVGAGAYELYKYYKK